MLGRFVTTALLGLSLLACSERTHLPPLLHDPGEGVGNMWALCDTSLKQTPDEAAHHVGIVARLRAHFPPGSDRARLERELTSEGFQLKTCETDPTIRIATFRWRENWGGQGLITYKSDDSNRIVWATGTVSYGGP
jgi:hypothetical protein